MGIPSIGPKVSDSILAFFRQPQNINIIDKLRKAGVKHGIDRNRAQGPAPIRHGIRHHRQAGSVGQAGIGGQIRALGGKAGSDVTRKTDYLVVGADPGSKLARAQSLGIKILDENEFLEMLEGRRGKLK